MKILITGGFGFVGSKLAEYLINYDVELFLIDNFYRIGSDANRDILRQSNNGKIKCFDKCDVTKKEEVEILFNKHAPFDAIIHLAGQVAMTRSVENPLLDFETNALGTLLILEQARKLSPESIIIFSSSNKVYGTLDKYKYTLEKTRFVCDDYPQGFSEELPLDFSTPYGCSKGSADQYVLDYNSMFGLRTIVFRHSTIYGQSQNADFHQGWISWFCQEFIKAKDFNDKEIRIAGTGLQVRDALHIDDLCDLYGRAIFHYDKKFGCAFNIGGGITNSLSLLELFSYLKSALNVNPKILEDPFRKSDQKVFISDNTKAQSHFNWQPKVSVFEGIRKML